MTTEIKHVRIKMMAQIEFLPDGVRVWASRDDRERRLHHMTDSHILVDDGGGFEVDQEFLDSHDLFVDWLVERHEKQH